MEHLNPAKRGWFTRPSHLMYLTVLFLLWKQAEGQKEVCRQRPMDIVFVIDGSRSVRPWNFKTVKDSVKDMVDSFDNVGPDGTQIGLIQYGSLVRQEFGLNQFQTKEEINEAIDGIIYKETGTMTGSALKYLVTKTFTARRGARMNDQVQKVAVVITDGRAQDRDAAAYWAKRVKESGIEVFAIGVGRRIKDEDLLKLASEPKETHKFYVKNFDLIQNLPVMLSKEVCDIDECTGDSHGCEQICINTIGSYKCSCFTDFELREDGRTCRRKQPPNPVNLVFTEVTHTSMVVNWDLNIPEQEDVVEFYNVVYKKSDGSGKSKKIQVKDRTAVLQELTPGTEYTVVVTAVAQEVESAAVTGKETTLKLGETKVNLSDPTLTTMTARWSPAGGDLLTGYKVLIAKVVEFDGGVAPDQEFTFEVGPDVHTKVIRKLTPDEEYKITVTPIHGNLSGGVGSDTLRTESLHPPEVAITKTTLSTVKVEWSGVGMEAERFNVALVPNDGVDGKPQAMEVNGDMKSATFRNLKPDTWYTATVIGTVQEDGQVFTSPEGSAQGKTKDIPTPSVKITDTGLSTADVLWVVEGAAPSGFSVSYHPSDNPDAVKSFETEDISAKLRGLEPGTEYTVNVVSVEFDDDIRFTSELGSDTNTTKMLHAPKVTATGESFTTATVTWTEIGMKPRSWKVDYTPVGSVEEPTNEKTRSQIVPGDLRSLPLYDLEPGVEYEVTVTGVVEEDWKPFESPVGISGFTLGGLNPPVVEIPSTTETTLDATWTSDVKADNYIVKIKEVGGKLEQTFKVPGDVKEKTFTSLKPGTQYKVTVYIELDNADDTIRSGPGMAADFTRPAPPGNLRSVGRTSTTLTATFDLPEGGSDYFEAYCKPAGYNPIWVRKYRVEKNDTTFTCTGLRPGIEYEIIVTNHFRDMVSDHATMNAFTILGPPQNFDLSEPTTHSIVATWEPPEHDPEVTEYILRYLSDKFGSIEEVKVPGSQTRYVLMELHPETLYQATLQAVVEGTDSSQVQDSETTLPDTIHINVQDTGANTILVVWPQSSVPHVTSQELLWSPQGVDDEHSPLAPPALEKIQLGPNVTSYLITDLLPATTYDISIRYFYPLGASKPATTEGTTSAPPPVPLSFTNITDMDYVIQWGMPGFNAMPIGYTVTYVPSYGGSVIEIEVPNGGLLNLNTEDLLPGTEYNVTVVANYRNNIVSEPVAGQVTTKEPQEEPVCSCGTYMARQAQMENTINKLVKVIENLAQKIDRMGGSSASFDGLQEP